MRIDGIARRKALLFGLEMGLTSAGVVELEWRHLSRLTLTPFAHALMLGHPRHVRLNYVFWEALPAGNVVSPIVGFADDVWRATDSIGYDRLLHLYRDMVKIDSELDLTDVIQQLSEVIASA